MWKRFLVRRRSVILTWLFSYLVILTVPILISIFVYYQSQETLKSEIHRANNVLLKEVRETVDNQIQNAERLTTELTWNVSIRGFMYSSLYKTPGSLDPDLYNLYKTAKELAIYQSLYPSIKTYYVYWKNQDIVFEPGVYRSSKLAFETIHENETISYEIWLRILQDKNEGHFIKLENTDSPAASTLAYIHSFPGNRLEKPPGATVVLLDTSRLMETIRNVQDFSSGQAMILNRNRQVLLSTRQNGNPLALSNLDFADSSGSYFADYEGQPSEYMYIKSQNSELIYLTVVPSSQVWKKTDYLRNITYIGMLVSAVGGTLLSIIFLLRNYSPVQRLLRLLKGAEPASPYFEGNEFLHIQNAISDTLQEKGEIQVRMQQHSYLLRSNMLSRMFKGKLEQQIALDESLSAFDVHFQSEYFAVILFYMDYERFIEHLDEISGIHNKPRLMQFIVTNIVEDFAKEKHRGFVCEMDDNMACLINFNPGDPGQFPKDVRELTEQACRFLSEKFNIHALAAISGIKSTVEDISQAYREALDAMEYTIVVGAGEIINYEEIQFDEPDEIQAIYYYPIEVEQQLMNHVKAGDSEKAAAIIREIISRSMGQAKLSVPLIKCLMFNLISTLIKTVGEIGDAEENALVNNTIWITRLMNCESLKEMELQLLAVVREVCEYTTLKQKQLQQSSRSQTLKELNTDIMEYISNHYMEANLNISSVGEHFGLTPTYLSKLFKNQSGKGLLDTINHFRVMQAKALLREPRNSIKSISLQVGFHDINTFIRTFKKYEGVTPGQYQKIL
ncbi:helix-turn-helix domain-containing protein [Paenibacillus sp. S150]|uniref:helix-turn-helix domain-containing protein n=1 Tax=Paenibacillus sp. S150 TaxID=2749826 RepID=UPI001C578B75|nr:helix-turn-helix domain-containing protein [Paenibacillus sp. S150]MBW4081225.1 helix-turn-helix transcriptional regulator [Paenibacillus sp. S150]